MNVNNRIYCEVVKDWLIPALKEDGVFHYQLMQDGATTHTCQATQEFLGKHEVNVLPFWPAFSPDLNPIENVWHLLKQALKKKYRKEGLPSDQYSFYVDANSIFHHLCNMHLKKLFNSVKNRLKLVLEGNGQRIRY